MKNSGKLVFAALALFGCIVVSSVSVRAQVWGGGPVVVYDQRDGQGRSQAFDIGIYLNNRRQLGTIGNDRATSVEVPTGYRVRFCDGEGRGNGSGQCEEFGPGYHNLRYSNKASYIRVTGPLGGGGGGWNGGGQQGVTVYDDRDFGGRSQTFSVGRYLNNRGQLGAIRNDEASSVVVERGFRVRFCEGEGTGNGSGRCEEYSEGRFNLRLNDEASYIEVQRTGGWNGGGWNGGNNGGGWTGGGDQSVTVYDDRDFRGRSQTFGEGRYLNSRGQLGAIRNDEASSVVVQRGFRVRFCEGEGTGNGAGRCDEYGEGRFNLRLNDEASYIEVQRTGVGWTGGNNGGGWTGGGNQGESVIVYSERNQSGDRQFFGVGTFRNDLRQLGSLKNDDATSIYVPQNYRVRICAGEGGGRGSGRCEEYGPGSRNLRYNDEMSYIRVWRTRF
ncbi:MAG: hypothetical protein WBO10_08800 [Pyrinomonadaceae bacterium]